MGVLVNKNKKVRGLKIKIRGFYKKNFRGFQNFQKSNFDGCKFWKI